jgi:glucose-6-phosphate 1-dehydrogenase
MIGHFVIFGASGDLTSRFLLPTLAQLHQAGKLPAQVKVLGIAPEQWDIDQFRHYVRERFELFASNVQRDSREALIAALDYRRADVTRPEEVKAALASVNQPAVVYLALPPSVLLAAA